MAIKFVFLTIHHWVCWFVFCELNRCFLFMCLFLSGTARWRFCMWYEATIKEQFLILTVVSFLSVCVGAKKCGHILCPALRWWVATWSTDAYNVQVICSLQAGIQVSAHVAAQLPVRESTFITLHRSHTLLYFHSTIKTRHPTWTQNKAQTLPPYKLYSVLYSTEYSVTLTLSGCSGFLHRQNMYSSVSTQHPWSRSWLRIWSWTPGAALWLPTAPQGQVKCREHISLYVVYMWPIEDLYFCLHSWEERKNHRRCSVHRKLERLIQWICDKWRSLLQWNGIYTSCLLSGWSHVSYGDS